MSSLPCQILVLGAGELGEAVLSAICSHPRRQGAKITVLVRSRKPELCGKLAAWKVSPLYADITLAKQASDLAAIFRRFDIVISCTGMYAPPGTQLKIAQAAIQANVKRFFPWQFGLDYDAIGRGSGQDLFDEQLDVRDLLRGQDAVPWTIVSTGLFMPFLFEESFGVVVGLDRPDQPIKMNALGSVDNQVTVTTVEDIANAVAETLYAAPVRGILFLSGQTVSYGQVAAILREVLSSRTVLLEERSVAQLKKDLELKPADGMRKYRLVFGKGKGVSWEDNKTFNEQRGLKVAGVKEWAEKNLVER